MDSSFNPRARKGCDLAEVSCAIVNEVSIHAPARGATGLKWGRHFFHTSFNPRARKGRDLPREAGVGVQQVSIHAPARGATDCDWWWTHLMGFQSTRPQGARQEMNAYHGNALMFQSTRPQGARPKLKVMKKFSYWFQSTRPQGARRFDRSGSNQYGKFQSTRPQGARPIMETWTYRCSMVSIHAPARGATAFDLVKNEKAQGKNIIALRPQSIYLEK